jgi:hypothetical protein
MPTAIVSYFALRGTRESPSRGTRQATRASIRTASPSAPALAMATLSRSARSERAVIGNANSSVQ